MLFTTCIFMFLFLPVVLGGYYLMRSNFARNLLLTAASLFFYSWGEPTYCWVMLAVVGINYAAAIAIEQLHGARKPLMVLTVIANLATLAWFKYSGFLTDNINAGLAGLHMPQIEFGGVHLPLGISFFVFHSLSYVIDVYRGVATAQRNPFNMALYISLFPQLIAGPIVRYHEIKDQLTLRSESFEKFAEGIRRFVVGLAKKMLVANAVAQPADQIFALPASELGTATAWLGAICYMLQIYFDFSGYSDMAVGLGLMFGFRLPENFNYPYVAKSIREFWQRWHMSLSNWFRDYLYIPLGGNRVSAPRVCTNLLIVFLLCGLWHGASWQFIAWGAYHGTFLGAERAFLGTALDRLAAPLRHVYVLFVVLFGWVLFRVDSMPHALTYYSAMLALNKDVVHAPLLDARYLTSELTFIMLLGVLFAGAGYAKLRDTFAKLPAFSTPYLQLRTIGCLALLALCVFEIASTTYNPFIYFRF